MGYFSRHSRNVRSAVFLDAEETTQSFESASVRAANEECEKKQ
jgi:hypothetical protein